MQPENTRLRSMGNPVGRDMETRITNEKFEDDKTWQLKERSQHKLRVG